MSAPDLRASLALYLVSPEGWGSHEGDDAQLTRLLRAGVGTVQFREKEPRADRLERATRMRAICREYGALFLVNDDLALAQRLDADGVHVGVDDASVAVARAQLGADKIVGATARTQDRAQRALAEGADYLGVGAIYDATASKADAVTGGLALLRQMREQWVGRDACIVAIGGITLERAPACVAAGADGVAMIRGFWGLRDPHAALADYRAALQAPRRA